MKIIIALAFVAILAALASAGLFMIKRGSEDQQATKGRMARALAIRVGLSVSVFLFVLLSYFMGWIEPTGLPIGR
ncbi:twin transmembrane helix small protein [Sphaerotilus sp.]|uniref:twin transmembrane helix small protein n=1 Tax=Sphaerotilus sp. TaxID=2093942 RepID=UPI0034E2200E